MENKILNHTFIMKLRKIIPAAVLLVLITTVLIGCGKGGEEPKTEESAQDKQKLPIVKVMDVTTSSFSENLNVVGIVKPFAMAKISSEEGGLITVLNKEKGSYVRRGEIIARIKKDVEIATFEQ